MRYEEALSWLFTQSRGGAERGPGRAAALLGRLGLAAPPLTVSVVGTNGKGSVTAMIAAGLTAHGLRTGRFLSPHVESFTERIAVDGVEIDTERVTEFVERVAAPLGPSLRGATRPAFFEWTLALALSEFARQGSGAAVLEAGVGGASDATRAVEGVRLVVLTNVDLDHADALGGSLEAIATDKAGAARAGAPLVSGVRQPELRRLVEAAATEVGAELHQFRPEVGEQPLFALPGSPSASTGAPSTRLENARLAVAALRLLGASEQAVAAALAAPPLPARGERFLLPGSGTAGGPVEVLLDGAHDPAAARRLLKEAAGVAGARPYVLLFGALSRKQGGEVLALLAERALSVIVTEASEGEGPPADLAGAEFVADPAVALERAVGEARAQAEDALVLVAGSLYLAGRLRPELKRRARLSAAG